MKKSKTKRILALILTLTLILTAIPLTALPASAATGGDYEYEVISETDKTCEITKYTGSAAELTIPSRLDGYKVTEISGYCDDNGTFRSAFEDNTVIESVIIGNGITDIRTSFSGCTSLTSITIPNSVIWISDWAFFKCTSLANITIPSSVEYIGPNSFRSCTALKAINVSNLNKAYSSIDGILFNKDKTELVCYPAGKSGAYTIPSGVVNIGDAFTDCTSLTGITIPSSVTSIGVSAFFGCTALTSVAIPGSVTYIGWDSFENCTSLASITIADGVTGIDSGAFYNTAYYNDEANWENGVLYIGNHLIKAKEDISGEYQIKEGTKTIADTAFANCTALTGIAIPDSVNNIGYHTFAGCTSLVNITIPSGVTKIGDKAFGYRFYSSGYKKIPNFTISGYKGSEAERYANDNGFTFIELEPAVTPGDVNGDGKVSAVDAGWALQCAAKKRTLDEKQTKAADMNEDGKITAVDARQILKKAAGK